MLSVYAHEPLGIPKGFSHKIHEILFHGPHAIWDLASTDFINKLIPRNIFMDEFFSLLSFRGNYRLVAILIIFLLIMNFRKTLGRKIWHFVLAASISAFSVEFLLKNFFHRIRPFFTDGQLIPAYVCPNNYSFPSGHAAVSFALATVAAHYDRKRAWIYYTGAVLISLSRIYLGCHYFMDVLIGAILGITIGKITLKLKRI